MWRKDVSAKATDESTHVQSVHFEEMHNVVRRWVETTFDVIIEIQKRSDGYYVVHFGPIAQYRGIATNGPFSTMNEAYEVAQDIKDDVSRELEQAEPPNEFGR